MIHSRSYAFFFQYLGNLLGLAATHAIYYPALTPVATDEIEDSFHLLFLAITSANVKTQVGAVERRNEYLRVSQL